MKNIRELIGNKLLLIDGAMGTLLMEGGVRPEECFDLQNLFRPDLIKSIHKKYIDAGCDIIETNTFGANRIKLKDYNAEDKVSEINGAAVSLAQAAAGNQAYVCGSIGPLGKLLKPMGETSFDCAVEVFSEQAKALEAAGADILSIETISDLQEMRAAVIGAKNSTKLPIIASLTYDENGRTVFGTPPEAAVVVLEALGIDVISANCSTGPEGILKIAKKLKEVSRKPIMVMPNAGMPVIENDKAVYKMTPKKFADFALKFYEIGVSIIGGCCGTTPEHIHEIKIRISKSEILNKSKTSNPKSKTRFASRTKVVELQDKKLFVIGERINPTGRKLLREDIKGGGFLLIRDEAVMQKQADLLDVNVSVPEGNDPENMAKAIEIISKSGDAPLSIDCPNKSGLEAGLKEFCGKALLNSVNGKKESLESILPLAKKYGAAIIGLTLDESGIPKTSRERLIIAGKIINEARKVGIRKEDIFIDTLVITAAVGIDSPLEALKAIPLIKEKYGVRTSLGISNVSHGLPNRSKINALFLRLAMLYGLDAAIIDITDKEIKKVLASFKRPKKPPKKEIAKFLRLFAAELEKAKKIKPAQKKETKTKQTIFKNFPDIKNAVIDGDLIRTKLFVGQALIKGFNPQGLIDKALVPGMEIVGARFSKKIYFLPQVLASAEAMAAGFALCKAKIPKGEIKISGKILVATVHGDIHDIGKNIVKMMLENHGFEVIDLGKDVPAQKIIEAAKTHKPNAIALSALLTTTMLEMKLVKEELKKAGLNIPIIIGGAVVTPDYAQKIEASYGSDAAQAVKLVKEIVARV